MTRSVVSSWREIREGQVLYFVTETRFFEILVLEKDQKQKAIYVEVLSKGEKRHPKVWYRSIPAFLKEGKIRRTL